MTLRSLAVLVVLLGGCCDQNALQHDSYIKYKGEYYGIDFKITHIEPRDRGRITKPITDWDKEITAPILPKAYWSPAVSVQDIGGG